MSNYVYSRHVTCLCMYVCMYTYVSVCIHAYMYVWRQIGIYVAYLSYLTITGDLMSSKVDSHMTSKSEPGTAGVFTVRARELSSLCWCISCF